jgi:hypothetical protein
MKPLIDPNNMDYKYYNSWFTHPPVIDYSNEHHQFIDACPLKTCISSGFPVAVLDDSGWRE